MAIIPFFRVIVFVFVTLFSLVVLGICAHVLYLTAGFVDVYTSFAPLGIAVASLSAISLPLFLALGNLRNRVFTSMILFEIIWFFLLWVLWVGTAGDTVAGRAYFFPYGCDGSLYLAEDSSLITQICDEFTVVEAFSFLNFFIAFIYYDVVFLYAIINAIRGRGIWTVSVKEVSVGAPGSVNPGVPMGQPQFNAPPGTQYPYGTYPANVPPNQPYNAYPQQVPPQGVPPQAYGAYPQQAPTPGSPPLGQQYNAYQQPIPPQGAPAVPPGQNQPYGYAPVPGVPQQQYAGYSPSQAGGNATLPPQPNYGSHPSNTPPAQLPLPSGYQEQPAPQPQTSQYPMPM